MRDQPFFDPVHRHERWVRSMAPGALGGTMLSARPFPPKRRYSFEVPDDCEPVETLLWLNMFAAAGPHVIGLAVVDGDLWQYDTNTHELYRTDIATGATLETVVLAGLGTGGEAGMAYDGTDFWITHDDGIPPHFIELRRYDRSGALLQSHHLDHANYGGPAWDGSHLWITDGAYDLVKRVDPDTGVFVDSFSPPGATGLGVAGYNGGPIAYDPETGRLWFNGYDRNLYVCETDGTHVATYTTPRLSSPAVAIADRAVWSAAVSNDQVYRADFCV